ncbi:MAG: YSC84-related protein [Verrucomicrobiota bacterium]
MKIQVLLILAVVSALGNTLKASPEMNERLRDVIAIVEEKQNSSAPVPRKIIEGAKGIAIIEITKGGFGISGQHGKGVLIAKAKDGWSAPSAFDASGGGLGLQVGVEVRKLIYILNNADAVNAFAQDDKFKLNAIANATAGPDNVTEEASTINKHDIYVYSMTEGAFAGAAIGGEMMSTNLKVNRKTYGSSVSTSDILNGKITRPENAKRLYTALGVN